MSDQGKWFKLWCSSLRDDDLENLSIHEWFAWARFGVHVKENGKDGKIRLRSPATAVLNLLRVTSFNDAVDMIKRFPNYEIEEIKDVTVNDSTTVSVKCRNWNKYQGDWSRDRVRKHRIKVTANVTAQEEKRSRRDVEEKRREDNSPLIPPKAGFSKPTPEEVTAYARSVGFDLDGRRFCDHYAANGWRVGKNPMKDWKASVRTWARNDYGGNNHASNGSPGVSVYGDIARRARQAQGLREPPSTGEVLAGLRSMPPSETET